MVSVITNPWVALVSSSAQVQPPLVSGGPVIRLPEAGLVLTKLPPIRDTVSLPPAPQVSCGWSARGHVTPHSRSDWPGLAARPVPGAAVPAGQLPALPPPRQGGQVRALRALQGGGGLHGERAG